MVTSDFRPEVEIWPFRASGNNYRNTLFILDEAMGQIPRSTIHISSIQNVNCRKHNMREKYAWLTRSSSGDEIANVNFLCDDIVHALKIQ